MAAAPIAVAPNNGNSSAVVPYSDASDAAGCALAVLPQAQPSPSTKTAWDTRIDESASCTVGDEDKLRPWYWELESKTENIFLLFLAVLDNLLCYVTWAQVRSFHGRLYSIVDLQLTLLPGLDAALLTFTILGTLVFVLMLVMVECGKKHVFNQLMNLRVYFSALPCALICFIIIWNSEQSLFSPFAALTTILFLIVCWCIHTRIHYFNKLSLLGKILIDISGFLAVVCGLSIIVLFATNNIKAITASNDLNCAYAANKRMPVRWLVLDEWYCIPWDGDDGAGRIEISRQPINVGSPTKLSCSDTFVSAFGVSLHAHEVHCPQGCLRNYQGADVIGCGIYAANSPICLAAVHAGMLTDAGGNTTVLGRVGVPHFERCSRYSVMSADMFVTRADQLVTLSQPAGGGSATFFAPTTGGNRRLATTPVVLAANGVQIPQAFHFNNQPHTQEFLHLNSYYVVSSKDPDYEEGKPWTRIKAKVSARIAGLEIDNEEVPLGAASYQPLFVQARQGEVFEKAPPECRVRASGVHCRGAGSAVVHLDFCQSAVKTCL